MKKLVSVFVIAMFLAGVAHAQQVGKIRGKVTDEETGEAVPFSNIMLYQNGIQRKVVTTDQEGEYLLSGLSPGKYDVIFVGSILYRERRIQGVSVGPGRTERLSVRLRSISEDLEVVEAIGENYQTPIIIPEGPIGGMDGDDYRTTGFRDISDAVALVPGTVSKEGEGASMKGIRPEGTLVYIDGVKQIARVSLSPSAIERVDVLTGGVPVLYGDLVGGVVSITTKGASSELYGGVEYETGRLFDQYNWDIAGFNVAGPILADTVWYEDTTTHTLSYDTMPNGHAVKNTKLGYFFAAQYTGMKDPRPSAGGITKVKDDVYEDLVEFPLERNSNGYNFKAEHLTSDDFEKVKVRPNVQAGNVSVNGKVDYQPNPNTAISFGGTFTYDQKRGYSGIGESNYMYRYSLLNAGSNPLYRNNNYNLFARIKKSLDNGTSRDGVPAAISNAYYQIQLDYSKSKTSTMDPDHRDRLFEYGYLGMLDTDHQSKKVLEDGFTNAGDYTMVQVMPMDQNGNMIPKEDGFYYQDLGNGSARLWKHEGGESVALHTVSTEEAVKGVYLQSGIGEYGVHFTPDNNPSNTAASNVLAHYFSLEDEIGYDVRNIDDLPARGLYYNGQRAPFISGLWYGPGRAYGGYEINDNTQIRLSALASAEVNQKHQITFGFEYEQRDLRNYSVNAPGLWGLARSEVNQQFMNNDGELNYDYSSFTTKEVVAGNNYYDYDFLIDSERQSAFDRNLRTKMGYDDQEFIDFDAIDPSHFSIDMFDANRLWDFNGGLIDYKGYDFSGKRLKHSSIEFEDFFLDPENRPQVAANPIYTSLFMEDKFEIEDLIIRFGVRVDRYDANQRVLKDKYSTVDLSLVGETDMSLFKDASGNDFITPEVVEKDWAIYVDQSSEDFDNNQEEYTVVGFRDGEFWYDASGNEVPNPTYFTGGSSILNPWFDFAGSLTGVNKTLFEDKKITLDAFEDYRPQVNAMPRLAFSFPISEKAGFYAHYDVLTQRPYTGNVTTASDYFYLQQRGFLNNANLKPVKKINYQLGFQQRLSKQSGLILEVYYNEFRNEIAFTRVNYAYPASYTTYSNIDFGTSKGMTVTYDLRRIKNFRANVSYSLQFAEGTGSGSGTAQALVAAGFDNLKVPFALSFDQRHSLKANMDYRFEEVKARVFENSETEEKQATDSNPKEGGKLVWYSNLGLNLTLIAGSGTPYSKNASRQSEVLLGIASQSRLEGSPNGSRLPWTFRATMRLDKDLRIRNAVIKDEEKGIEGKEARYVNIYLYVQNLFNNKNILNVYRNTGQPDDDGYLVTVPDLTQSEIDMYKAALVNPANISMPRRARIGISYSF